MAIDTIKATAILDGAVATAKLANGAVDTAQLANSSVTTDKITDSNITTAKIGNDAVTTAKIGNDAVTSAKIGDGEVSETHWGGHQFGNKNLVINGAMSIFQRGHLDGLTNWGSDNTYYYIDRFAVVSFGNPGGQFTCSRESLTPGTDLDAPFHKALKIAVTTASSLSSENDTLYGIQQRIEGYDINRLAWGTSQAKNVTLSFWVKSSITGTYAFNMINNTASVGYTSEYTISSANTWEKKTINISGPTTGTWQNGTALGISMTWGLGASGNRITATSDLDGWYNPNGYTIGGSTNSLDLSETLNATFELTGIQLEEGDTATNFEYRPLDNELSLCQRYYNDFGGTSYVGIVSGMQQSSTLSSGALTYPEMRASPSIGFFDLIATDRTVFDENATQSGSLAANSSAYIRFTHGSRGSARDAILLAVKNGTSGKLTLESEL